MFHICSLSLKLWQMETISWCYHVHYLTSLVIWKDVLCQNIFFPEALVILSKRRTLGERKVSDKFPFPILDSSIKIDFLCSKCSCPCFVLVKFRLPSPDVERIYTARYSPFSRYRPHRTLLTPSPLPKKIHNHCLRFLLGRLVTPRRNWKQWLCKFLFLRRGAGWVLEVWNKVHYGQCEIGELPARINIITINMTKRYAKSVIYYWCDSRSQLTTTSFLPRKLNNPTNELTFCSNSAIIIKQASCFRNLSNLALHF